MRQLALCLLLLAAPAAAHAQFRDDATGLVISPPEFLVRQGEDPLASEALISCWSAPATGEYPWLKMCAERQDRLPGSDERLSFRWEGHTLNGSRSRLRVGDEEIMQYSALIPLRRGTIRLDVLTPVRGSAEGKAVLEETLATVRDVGPATSAFRSADDSSRVARGIGRLGMLIVIIGTLAWFRGRRRRQMREVRSTVRDMLGG